MCDTFASIGASGALFAKNSDRPSDEVQLLRWHPPRAASGEALRLQYISIPDAPAHGVLLSQPTWLWGAEHGVNDQGVAIGNERLFASHRHDGDPSLIGMDLVRLGLERGADADEALEVITGLIERHGQGGSGDRVVDTPYDSSFLVVDARRGWIIETFGAEWVAAPLTTHGAISNRYGLGRDWTRSSPGVRATTSTHDWHDERVDTRLADHRLKATLSCAAANRSLDPTTAIATLRDHGSGPWGRPGHESVVVPPPAEIGDDMSGITVCMHAKHISTTTASMVAHLATGDAPRVWACIGSPCVSEYVPVDLDPVPAGLGDEAQWHAAAARRDRVEADGRVLAAIRQDIAEREATTFGDHRTGPGVHP